MEEKEVKNTKKQIKLIVNHKIDIWEGIQLGLGFGIGLIISGLFIIALITILGMNILANIF